METKIVLISQLIDKLQERINNAEKPFKITIETQKVSVGELKNFIIENNIPDTAMVSGKTEETDPDDPYVLEDFINFEWEVSHSEMTTLQKISHYGRCGQSIVRVFERWIDRMKGKGYDTSNVPCPSRTLDIYLFSKDIKSLVEHLDEVILPLEKEEEGDTEEGPW